MSVLDFREQRGSEDRAREETSLRIRGRIHVSPAPQNLDLCLILLDFLKVAESLTDQDREILEALREARSVRGAVRAMSRPVKRCYVQKRLKVFRERVDTAIGAAVRGLLGVHMRLSDETGGAKPDRR